MSKKVQATILFTGNRRKVRCLFIERGETVELFWSATRNQQSLRRREGDGELRRIHGGEVRRRGDDLSAQKGGGERQDGGADRGDVARNRHGDGVEVDLRIAGDGPGEELDAVHRAVRTVAVE